MANDWIKMRIGLEDDPSVISIARALKLEPDHVCGKLLTLWGWADQNTADGRLNGVDATWIDLKVRKKGFAKAMTETVPPWLIVDPAGVTIPNFDRHNGSSAKSRAENTKRQHLSRKTRDESATREEKRRILAPADGGDWKLARQKSNELSEQLGTCSKSMDRRLLLGATFLSQFHENGAKWLEIAARETKHTHPKNPYAFFQTVVYNQANADGIDLSASIGRLEIPEELLERRRQTA